MPDMTLTQAAKWAGVTRATIHKAIKSGRLSAAMVDGVYRINPAELERVYQPGQARPVSADAGESSGDTAGLMAGKDREMALMRELLDAARREAADWKAEAQRWHEQAEAQTRLLTHQPGPEPAEGSAEQAAAELRGVVDHDLAELRAAVESLAGSKAAAPEIKRARRNRVIDAAGPSLARWLFRRWLG